MPNDCWERLYFFNRPNYPSSYPVSICLCWNFFNCIVCFSYILMNFSSGQKNVSLILFYEKKNSHLPKFDMWAIICNLQPFHPLCGFKLGKKSQFHCMSDIRRWSNFFNIFSAMIPKYRNFRKMDKTKIRLKDRATLLQVDNFFLSHICMKILPGHRHDWTSYQSKTRVLIMITINTT